MIRLIVSDYPRTPCQGAAAMTCRPAEHLWRQFWRGVWRCVICGALKGMPR